MSTFNFGSAEADDLFVGVPTSVLNINLQQYFFGYKLQNAENIHLTDATATGIVGHGLRVQSDIDVPAAAHFTAFDCTNLATSAIIGHQVDVYYSVPLGATNNNIQTSFENNLSAYGPGTSAGACAFEGSANNSGAGTVGTLMGFYATGFLNFGGGAVHNVFGFKAESIAQSSGSVGDTLNAGFYSADQGSNANDYAFYSVGGKNYFGGMQGSIFGGPVTAPSLIESSSHTPISATDSGMLGQIAWDASYVYVCIAANTWKRSALSSW